MLLNRMRPVGRGELGSEQTIANHVRRARLSFRRLLATLRTKIPRYVYAWKSGHLKPHTIRRNAMLVRSSNTLFSLIEQETSHADQASLREITSRAL
jgi:hypothetical protein